VNVIEVGSYTYFLVAMASWTSIVDDTALQMVVMKTAKSYQSIVFLEVLIAVSYHFWNVLGEWVKGHRPPHLFHSTTTVLSVSYAWAQAYDAVWW